MWFAVIYKLYIKKKSIKTDALYFYLVSILPYFIFEFYINKTPFLLTVIFIILIYKFIYTRKERKMKNNYIYKIIVALNNRNFLKWIPDKIILKYIYREQFNKNLNFKNVNTFNEKLQWLKLVLV